MSSSRSSPDYSGVTETPGTLVTTQAASMAVSRYEVVRRAAAGKRVLEIACGSGQGLGYVGGTAAWVVGGDITPALLRMAQAHYAGGVPLVQFDAHRLPFASASFDVVEIHEAIYYMSDLSLVFSECRRVLTDEGVLILSSINPDWIDFNPSPQATRYLRAKELDASLASWFRRVEVTFGFPVEAATGLTRVVSLIKRAASHLGVIPKTMAGKTVLKRLFLGALLRMPPEIRPGFAAIDEPSQASLDDSSRFRVIYAVARS